VAPQPVLADQALVHIGVFMLVPLIAVAAGVVLAWVAWRLDPATDPARVLGPARRVFAGAFYLDEVQDALVVRPAKVLARAVRRADESGVDGLVEGTGRRTVSAGAWLAGAHRAPMPRAVTAVLSAALLLGLAAVVIGGMS
jgi:NADH-quinone oxidoreductase subunit L